MGEYTVVTFKIAVLLDVLGGSLITSPFSSSPLLSVSAMCFLLFFLCEKILSSVFLQRRRPLVAWRVENRCSSILQRYQVGEQLEIML
jgi:hypothetical protein